MNQRVVLALIVVSVGGVLAFWALQKVDRSVEAADRKKCAANMIALGHAVLMYGNENKGRYPPGVRDLMVTQDIGSEVFNCPASGHTPARAATFEEQVRKLDGEHLSYMYVGGGMTHQTTDPNAVLMYEKPTNHDDGRINVLFADLHVELFGRELSKKIVDELNAGRNPPMTPSGPFAGQGRRIGKFDEVPNDNYYQPR
jgi:prepilin-type processing-associated H-X9-DG protein